MKKHSIFIITLLLLAGLAGCAGQEPDKTETGVSFCGQQHGGNGIGQQGHRQKPCRNGLIISRNKAAGTGAD